MKRKDLAEVFYEAARSKQLVDNYAEKLTDIISSAFTALGTDSPESALDLIEQLNGYKAKLQKAKTDGARNREAGINEIAHKMKQYNLDADDDDGMVN